MIAGPAAVLLVRLDSFDIYIEEVRYTSSMFHGGQIEQPERVVADGPGGYNGTVCLVGSVPGLEGKPVEITGPIDQRFFRQLLETAFVEVSSRVEPRH